MVRVISQSTVRIADRADLPSLEWNGEFLHFRSLYREIYSSMLRGEAIMWVAELSGRGVVGQIFVQLTSTRLELADGVSRAYIYGFRVQELYRSQGIGSQLLKSAELELKRRGFRRVSLNVNQDNLLARSYYQRRGYRVVSVEPGRWFYKDHLGVRREVVEPAWRMEKALIPGNRVNNVLD